MYNFSVNTSTDNRGTRTGSRSVFDTRCSYESMGVASFLKSCKQGASKYVPLNHGNGGRIIMDGGCLMHKSVHGGASAVELVLHDNVAPLALEMKKHVDLLTDQGWDVTIVFDGKSPPAKGGTSASRSAKREAARIECVEQHRIGNLDASRKSARTAAAFSDRVIARLSAATKRITLAETITAPYEADGQIKVMADYYSQRGRCLVFGTDSDLVLLGVPFLLWEVSSRNGILGGQVIERHVILNPPMSILENPDRGRFLRLLHGITHGEAPLDQSSLLPADLVEERLMDFVTLAGNDYNKISGLGPKIAGDIALSSGRTGNSSSGLDEDQLVQLLAEAVVSRLPRAGKAADVAEGVHRARDMFKHQVVWVPSTGQTQHLSGGPTSPPLQLTTGPLHPSIKGCRIAAGSISPLTLLPWDPPLEGVPQSLSRAPPRAARLAGRPSGEPGYLRSANGQQAASRLHPAIAPHFPGPGEDLSNLTVVELKTLLNFFRCMERAGVSTARKEELVKLAECCLHMFHSFPPGTADHLLRLPANNTTPAERTRASMPALPNADEFESGPPDVLREKMPEVNLSLILDWLVHACRHGDPPNRVFYRGVQRTMDSGALAGLSIAAGLDSTVWLKLRVKASMRPNTTYSVHAQLSVYNLGGDEGEEAATQDEVNDGEDPGSSNVVRQIATSVLKANCECVSGAGGGCHHVCMLLQLVRLLQMSSDELRNHNPRTPTGRACEWILNHCQGGRTRDVNRYWYLRIADYCDPLREARDPKGQDMGIGSEMDGPEAAASTRGVVQRNRARYGSPHPRGGRWAESRRHYDMGNSQSVEEKALFDRCFDLNCKLTTGKRGHTDSERLCTRKLPPRVRPRRGSDLSNIQTPTTS